MRCIPDAHCEVASERVVVASKGGFVFGTTALALDLAWALALALALALAFHFLTLDLDAGSLCPPYAPVVVEAIRINIRIRIRTRVTILLILTDALDMAEETCLL